jgi:hypothetical protein
MNESFLSPAFTGWDLHSHEIEYVTTEVTLANGSTAETDTMKFTMTGSWGSDESNKETNSIVLVPGVAPQEAHTFTNNGQNYYTQVRNVTVGTPTQDYDPIHLLEQDNYNQTWSQVETQNNEVLAELDTFIDATYEDYQQGDINESDLVDPYLGAREYSPETSDTWAVRTLAAMGAGSPADLSTIGVMNVSAGGSTYSGVLMSDGTPQAGYVVGETYNADSITGGQFVALQDGGVQELDGEFTLDAVETTTGEAFDTGEPVEYRTGEYKTSDIAEFEELQTDLDQLTAEINARQDRLRGGGGGSGWLPGVGNVGQLGPAALLAAGAALLLLRGSQ